MNADDPLRKKQLGQYFTGLPVARLLAALAGVEGAKSVIDPMVGVGDMLQACLAVGQRPETLTGLDIDPLAIGKAQARFADQPGVSVMCADVFAGPFLQDQYAVVITNPPYIRYQSKATGTGIDVPAAPTIRRNLLAAIDSRSELSPDAKGLLLETARAYPGTADVAVPAWILSAALVAEDGVLAVVVPQAWLSRNYAAPIRRLLDRAFDIEFLVEDGDASWFHDAQVRTHLLVARRRPVQVNARASVLVTARATRELANGHGFLFGDMGSEHELVAALRSVTSAESVPVTKGLKARGLSTGITDSVTSRPTHLTALTSRRDFRMLDTFGWVAAKGCGQARTSSST